MSSDNRQCGNGTEKTAGDGKARSHELKDVLATFPPGKVYLVSDLCDKEDSRMPGIGGAVPTIVMSTPAIELFCESSKCQGVRLFDCASGCVSMQLNQPVYTILHYMCRNCRLDHRSYAVMATHKMGLRGEMVKIGQWPAFGSPVPAKVQRLIQEDRELFLQGRRAENLGLGIGAFTYYRRVVENQKNRLFEQIIAAATRLGEKPERIAILEKAKTSFQFTQSVEDFKEALPESLLMNGHNPLTLLHTALSRGIHSQSDDDCLVLARDIRLVLTNLAERINQALRENREVDEAVGRLVNPGRGKG